MTVTKLQERDLAAPVRARLRSLGYTVSEEVGLDGRIADFVGSAGNCAVTVEMKTDVTLALLDQADFWRSRALESWIAVPDAKGSPASTRLLGYRLARDMGLGVMTVRPLDKREHERANAGEDMSAGLLARVTVIHEAHLQSNGDSSRLLSVLTKRHQVEQAGSKLCVRVNKTQTIHQEIRDYLDTMGGSATLERVSKGIGYGMWTILEWAEAASIVEVQLDMRGVDVMLRRVAAGDEEPVTAGTSKSNPRRRVA